MKRSLYINVKSVARREIKLK